MGSGTLSDPQPSPDVGFSCRFSWTADVRPAPQYRIVLADKAEWPLSGSDTLRDLTLKASAIAPLPTEEPVDDLEVYAGMFERLVRDTVGIHIKGIEDLSVTEDEVFVWVESRYSTESIFKDEMYELYDAIAADL
ncbi:hypothetical protein BH23CHL7_BH23CHL7_05150 [soil metagenome]